MIDPKPFYEQLRSGTVRTMATSGRTYRLEVQGELGDMSGRSFPDMRIIHRGGNTVLTGRVRDQAELSEILEHCSELALTVLSVVALDAP